MLAVSDIKGALLSGSDGVTLLRVYAIYLVFLAINGITELFATAVRLPPLILLNIAVLLTLLYMHFIVVCFFVALLACLEMILLTQYRYLLLRL